MGSRFPSSKRDIQGFSIFHVYNGLHRASSKDATGAECGNSELGHLKLRGKIVGQVRSVYPEIPDSFFRVFRETIPSDTNGVRYVEAVREWEAAIANAVLRHDTENNDTSTNKATADSLPLEIYWRTLIGNLTFTDSSEQPITHDWYLDFHAGIANGYVTSRKSSHDGLVETDDAQTNSRRRGAQGGTHRVFHK